MRRHVILLVLCLGSLGCGIMASLLTKPHYLFTDKARTRELLDIHQKIAPQIQIDFKSAKIVFFSDLHRGMGKRDFLEKNSDLFEKILDYYYAQSDFKLVMLGDIEEGWGFQNDNIPIILQWHKKEYDLEKKFVAQGRYYRVYGNHDDYYRANAAGYVYDSQIPVYPALIFEDTANHMKIFATHGCQGHGLHDAGDQVAAWGVFARYNWLYEIMPKKEKESNVPKKMDNIQKTYDTHEKYFYDWACDNKYNILIGGHTHRPLYESEPVDYCYEVLTRYITEGDFPLLSGLEELPESGMISEGKGSTEAKLSDYIKKEMLRQLSKEKAARGKSRILIGQGSFQTRYFNTGCGYMSEMPCIEINNGQVFLKFYGQKKDRQLQCLVYVPADKSMKMVSLN